MLERRRPTLGVRIADRALLTALRTLRWLLRPWPMSTRILIGGGIGRAVGRFSKRRRLALNNLKRAFRDDASISRSGLLRILNASNRDMGRSITEFLMSDAMDPAYFDTHVEIEGEERFRALVAEGKGVVLLTAHFGNWEFLNLMAGVRGHALAVVAKPQKLRRSDAYLNALRSQRGAKVVLRGMDIRQVYRTLLEGGLAGILADQDGGVQGVYAPLFGRQSSYPRGVARFSYKTGAPALPVFVARIAPDRHRIYVGSPIRGGEGESEPEFERRVVGDFSSQLEAMVRRHPSQWIWAHRRWKSSPNRDIAVLDDGRKGHLQQSLALAAKIAERRRQSAGDAKPGADTAVRTIAVRYRSAAARVVLTAWGILTGGRLPGGMGLLRWTMDPSSYRDLSTAPADTVISCGTATEAVNLILSRDCAARSCYIHKPQFGRRYFSAVLVPGHDQNAARGNTIRTRGALSFVRPERMRELRDRARTEAGIPAEARAAALLVGGPSKHTPWDPPALERLFFALRDSIREHKLYLLVTTSRRTDAAVESAVERLFTGEPMCPVTVIANRSNPSNAYEGILAASDIVLVTADSVSMISEAVSTGKPVGILAAGPARRGKMERFLESLERERAAERIDAGTVRDFLARAASPGVSGAAVSDPVTAAADLLAR